MIYTVEIRTTCRACAMALAGQAPTLGTIRAAFVQQREDLEDERPLTIHANSPAIKMHAGGAFACPEHGRMMDLSRPPGRKEVV